MNSGRPKEIPLTRGFIALVDEEDYGRVVARGKWCAKQDERAVYAQRGLKRDGKNTSELMHRFIAGVSDPKTLVDHRDGNGLNNQKYNLRICTKGQNRRNSKKRAAAMSSYKGVHRNGKKWQARIFLNGKNVALGTFATEKEAARAYDRAAQEHYQEFSKPNFALPSEAA